MCGIAGIVLIGEGDRLRAGEGEFRERLGRAVQGMAGALRHRGPDGLGHWVDPGGRCALGHSRLVVIDRDTGGQPMSTDDQALRVVFNGEIYNYRALRDRLRDQGHRFRTTSDTEVLLHAYRAWGPGFMERLEGMFAFALWDHREGRLLLGRDRAGEKPLYLWPTQVNLERGGAARALVFASELSALPWGSRALGIPAPAVDPAAFPFLMTWGHRPGPATVYREVVQVEPGTRLVVEAEGPVRSETYWRMGFRAPAEPPPADGVQRLRETVTAAVEARLVSDVPLGAFLSGGVDSSIVVGLMSRALSAPVRTFSIGFEGDPAYDETHHARTVAERFGTEHTEFHVGPQEIGILDTLVDRYGEPFCDSSALPMYLLSRLTREHVTVALTGDGGDDLFAGYMRFRAFLLSRNFPSPLARAAVPPLRVLGRGRTFRSPVRRLLQLAEGSARSRELRLLDWTYRVLDPGLSLLRPEVAELVSPEALVAPLAALSRSGPEDSDLARVLQAGFDTYLPGDLLVKADRMSMAVGLELRAPFLDSAVMAAAAGLPDDHRIRGGVLKWALKEAFRDLVPGDILGRPKQGFGIPLGRWMRNEWRREVEDRILGSGVRLGAFLDPELVGIVAREHMEGRRDHGHLLWTLLTLENWLNRIEGTP